MEGRFGSTVHSHCWLIFILYISSLLVFFPLVLFSKFPGQFSLCLALGYFVSVFNHWIIFIALCRIAFNVSGLCNTELACSEQDPQGLGFKPPSILWVHVVFLIFFAFGSPIVPFFILSFYVVFLHVPLWHFPSKHWPESQISISTLNWSL